MKTPDAPGGDRTNRLVPEPVVPPATFIVRLSATTCERFSGIVEHPGTGRKERFDGLDALGRVIAALRLSVGGPQVSSGSAAPSGAPPGGRAPPRPAPRAARGAGRGRGSDR